MNQYPGQPPHMNFGAESANVGQRHMNMIAELEQQKQNIIHNTTLYVQAANQTCSMLDQAIASHKHALSLLTHTMQGTAAPQPQQVPQAQQRAVPQPAPAPAPAPAPQPRPQPQAKPVAEAAPEVIHTPPPNGTAQ